MSFFSNLFRTKDGAAASRANKLLQNGHAASAPLKPRWEDAWTRKDVGPDEVHELIHICTQEMKSRALDTPFVLLPFRPNSDPTDARSFIRNFFKAQIDGSNQYKGAGLQQELTLTEPMALCSIMKWCWSRLPGGVVSWDAYELFRIGEQDSNMARHAFDTFIPLSVESDERKQIIFDFFELIAAIAAHGKTNGLGGRKLSRMAGWWAFEHSDSGKGFDGGYKSWASAADATSHLFFAYLRSRAPDPATGLSGINTLPRSLQALVSQTEYPPETPVLMLKTTTKVVMIVDSVSPTPFSLLRRAKHFEYRDDDEALQEFSSYDDPVQALTDECRRVLNCISSTNQSAVISSGGAASNGKAEEPSWSRFEDMGFGGMTDSSSAQNGSVGRLGGAMRTTPSSRNELGRPTTPSWADFLSTGFPEDQRQDKPALLLPPDKILPPIGESRVHSSQSHVRISDDNLNLEPGELASISRFDLDDTFWWVWMTSLAGEETADRKAVFGRCALIETAISGSRWLVMEEQVKGASPGPVEGAYIAEKKSRFSFTRRGRLGRRKSSGKKVVPKTEPYNMSASHAAASKTSIGPDQHARIQAAAAALKRDQLQSDPVARRRARTDEDNATAKTSSVMTLQPVLMSEAVPAMKWANEFDKDVIRAKYLGDRSAGKGADSSLSLIANGQASSPLLPREKSERELPSLPLDPQSQSQPQPQPQTQTQTPYVKSPSPPPLPVQPVERSHSIPYEAKTTPLPVPDALDEKRRPPPEPAADHPAYRRPAPAEASPPPARSPDVNPAVLAARRALEGHSSTPSPSPSPSADPLSRRGEPKKLKKTPGPRGLKNMFGRKKVGRADAGESSTAAQEDSAVVQDRTPAYENVAAPASEPHEFVSDPHVAAPLPPAQQSPATVVEEYSPAPPAYTSDPSGGPASSSTRQDESRPHLERITSHDLREADRQFARFDQGPLIDVPAFVPDSPDTAADEHEHEHAHASTTRARAPAVQAPAPVSVPAPAPVSVPTISADDDGDRTPRAAGRAPPRALPRPSPAPAAQSRSSPAPAPAPAPSQHDPIRSDKASLTSTEVSSEQAKAVDPVPVSDRWAQIRRNAAERAARQSESEQSRQSQKTNDDGETSGEETIESRVARIKARVAELTGNMDAQGNFEAHVKR